MQDVRARGAGVVGLVIGSRKCGTTWLYENFLADPDVCVSRKVKELPFEFTLDDSNALSPTMKLSSQTRVIVGARVSKTGQAMTQPGDLQGLSAAVPLGASGVKVEITEVIKP